MAQDGSVVDRSWCHLEVAECLQKGLSCQNAAFLLMESVATAKEDNKQVSVAFFDVAKAFDSVWIEGLFSQLWDAGVRGKTWQLPGVH